jgi:hypothetical protein
VVRRAGNLWRSRYQAAVITGELQTFKLLFYVLPDLFPYVLPEQEIQQEPDPVPAGVFGAVRQSELVLLKQAAQGTTRSFSCFSRMARFLAGRSMDSLLFRMCAELAPQQLQSSSSLSSIPRELKTDRVESLYSFAVPSREQPG